MSPQELAEFQELLWALRDERLTAEQAARLEERVLTNRAARRRYVQTMDLFVGLRWHAAMSSGQRIATLKQILGTRRREAPVSPSPPASSVLGFLGGLLHVGSESPVNSAFSWLVLGFVGSGIVMLLLFCIGLAFHRVGADRHVDGPNVAGSDPDGTRQGATQREPGREAKAGRPLAASSLPAAPSSLPSSTDHSGTVARLIHIADPRWAIGSHSPHVSDDLEAGRELVLLSGLAEVMFQSGVEAVLEGPATMEIGSRRSAVLRQGKLTVKVIDPDAHGFEVRTPGMKYTDLGTEFGISVAKDGTQKMVVFRGTVRAEQASEIPDFKSQISDGAPLSPSPHHPITPSSMTLSAHQAIRIASPGKPIEHIAADEAQFVRSEQMAEIVAEQSPEFVHWMKFSEGLRKRPDLVAYYDFQPDEADRTVLRNRAASGGKFDGELVGGAAWTEGRLAGKHALAFIERGSGVRVNIPVDCRQLTLVACVKLAPITQPRIRAILDSDAWHELAGCVHWQFHTEEAILRLDISAGSTKPNMVRSAERFHWAETINQWAVFTETYNETAARGSAYRNGRLAATDNSPKPFTARIGQAMIGGYSPTPASIELDHDRGLAGWMDELMIFDKLLSAGEIERMCREMRIGAASGAMPAAARTGTGERP
jgi:hypothetical protein